jgi:Na+-translocating ferredoxin:NAD+ oxidoreductase RnfG subunit
MNRGIALYPVIFIVLTLIISITSLAVTEKVTHAVLESQSDMKTLTLLQQIFADADYYSYNADTEIYFIYDNSRNETGYAFYGSDRGFRGDITVLIGLEDKETINGIVVVRQSEDYQYWQRLVYDSFFEQFKGLKIVNCLLKGYVGGLGQVDAASGATISSWGVVDAVRKTALEKVKLME